MLRQFGVHRILQTSIQGTRALGTKVGRLPETVQRLLFPGIAREDLVTLAKDMEFLSAPGTDVGGSIAAASRVLHPTSSLALPRALEMHVPLADPIARFLLGKYYSMVTWGVTHPAFIAFVAKGLRGSSVDRESARQAVQQAMGWGGAIGAGVGAAIPGAMRGETPEPGLSVRESNWREIPSTQGPRNWQRLPAHAVPPSP